MLEYKVIGIALTKRDRDIIAWLNLLERSGQSPRTWIQAVLLADHAKKELDIGGVFLPPEQGGEADDLFFGDDTVKKVREHGWTVRGAKGEYIVGSIFIMRVTRPAVLRILEDLESRKCKLSSYIKALLHKSIRTLPSGADVPPREEDLGLALFLPPPAAALSYPERLTDETPPKRKRRARKETSNVVKDTAVEQSTPQKTPADTASAQRNPLLDFMH